MNSSTTSDSRLEICCGDIQSIINAARGGAKRVELCCGLAEGGVTPPLSMVRKAAECSLTSINVLIRPRGADFLYSHDEMEAMISDIRDCRNAGATGIVAGVLTPDGEIDVAATALLREAAGDTDFIFHRAFDMVKNPLQELEKLKQLQVNRLLTSGCAPTAAKGIAMLRRLKEAADGEIEIMAGSGINPGNAEEILASGVDAIHATARTILPSEMKFRNESVSMGAGEELDEYSRLCTDPETVGQLKRITDKWLAPILTVILLILSNLSPLFATAENQAESSSQIIPPSGGLQRELPPEVANYLANNVVDTEERFALEHLYRYMPDPDIWDYSPQFFHQNVKATLQARHQFPWGESISEADWLNFVLPLRVNNEALDLSRPLIFEQLRERIAGMGMMEAMLEVNHWAHEHASYRGSDPRTLSPLATMRAAAGRCGEESTLLVAALRAAGIPARQVYSPRWAHTDSNHAWVEAFADGDWHFMGACEPAPVADLGWFNESASRGLLMHTSYPGPPAGSTAHTPTNPEHYGAESCGAESCRSKFLDAESGGAESCRSVFGRPEEVLSRNQLSTTINVTSRYAPTDTLRIIVADRNGSPVEGANVDFCIFNYCDYYPAVRRISAADGSASLVGGKGDFLVRASTPDGRFGIIAAAPRRDANARLLTDTIRLNHTLHDCANGGFRLSFDLVPPSASYCAPSIPDSLTRRNESRLIREDSIRNAFIDSFFSLEEAEEAALKLLPIEVVADSIRRRELAKILTLSRGNSDAILRFMNSTPPEKRGRALLLLTTLTEKDFIDISEDALHDFLEFAPPHLPGIPDSIYADYLLCPRVEWEPLRTHRSALCRELSLTQREHFRMNPDCLREWVEELVAIKSEGNPMDLRCSPLAALRAGYATPLNRSILFVALSRICGIPSRINPINGETQWLDLCPTANAASSSEALTDNTEAIKTEAIKTGENNTEANKDEVTGGGIWRNVRFSDEADTSATELISEANGASARGSLILTHTPSATIPDPLYYDNFAILRLHDSSRWEQLQLPDGTLSELFGGPMELECGEYLLLSERRMADGTVLAFNRFFEVLPDSATAVELTLRDDPTRPSVIGALDAETPFTPATTGEQLTLLQAAGRGHYILALLSPSAANHEPSAHFLDELAPLRADFEAAGVPMIILTAATDNPPSTGNLLPTGNLPAQAIIGCDSTGSIERQLREALHLDADASPSILPIIVIADSFNHLLHITTGYSIGTPRTLLTLLPLLRP